MPRILIVDDDADAADSLASLVQSEGYGEARVACTGATALALAVEFRPTVLLVDVDLADMSGYDVARHLCQHPHLKNLRLIALTASSEHPRPRAGTRSRDRALLEQARWLRSAGRGIHLTDRPRPT